MKNAIYKLKPVFICLLLMFCLMGAFGGSNVKKASAENITLHVWVSDTPMGKIPKTFYQSKWVYLCYELLDSSGNKIGNSYNNYQVTLYQYSPTNKVLNKHTYSNSDYNWISIKNSEIGRFTGKVYVTGSITVECGVDWYQNDRTPVLSLSKSALSLHTKNAKSSTVTCKVGGDIFDYDYNLSISNSNSSVVSFSWGSWYSNGEKCDFKVFAKKAGKAALTVKLIKQDDGRVLDSKTISITVSEPKKNTYIVSYNANGGMNAPASQTKTEGVSLNLSSQIPSKFYKLNYKTGCNVSVSSRKKTCKFNNWNTSSTGNGDTYWAGTLYTKDAVATLYAIWSKTVITSDDLPVLTRAGYEFLGWYTSSVGGKQIVINTTVTDDLTLYAHWSPAKTPVPNITPRPTPIITATPTPIYTIAPKSITDTEITLETTRYTYDGTEKKPSVEIKDGSNVLIKGVDYIISYTDNVKAGIAKVNITGIGKYTDTISKTFVISVAHRDFVWDKNNWSFNNSSYEGYFSSSKMIEQINSTYLSMLKSNLTNCEYKRVFDINKGSAYKNWGGSCYGMASTTLLAMENLLPYYEYNRGATVLSQLDYPVKNSKVNSLITYYQLLQAKEIIQQQYRTIPNKSHKENIQSIISQLDTNNTVLVCFKQEGKFAHAVLAYDYEYGSYTWNGVTYQGCIKICDPNSSKQYKKECNIYFNTNSFNWTIPYYSYVPITSVSGAKIMYAGADIDAINCGGYLSGTTDIKFANFVARIDAAAVADNRSVTKVKEIDGNYVIESNAPGDIVEDYSFVPGGESKGTIGYNLYDANASYQLSQNKAEKLQLSMDYEDCYLEGGSSAGNKIVFDKDGYVSVLGESADYNIAMTFDDKYPTDWFTIQVNGENSNEISLQKEDNGYVLSGDNLENVEINVNNREDSAYAKFTTKYSSAYIYEVDENKVGVKVDTDYNGTYETVLDIVNSAGGSTPKPSEKPSTPPEASFVPPTDEPSTLPSPSTKPSVLPSAPGVHSTAKPLDSPSAINATADSSDNYSDMGDLANHEKGTVEVGKTVVIKKLKYKITKLNKTGAGEVALMGTAEKKAGQKLKSIKIRNTVTIHKMSFKVTSIDKNAFSGCKRLKSLVLGKNITTIGNRAFYKCAALKKIKIPSGVTKIGKRAFYGCRHLKSIEIKSRKLKTGSVGKKVFWRIAKDAKIKVPKSKLKTYQKLFECKQAII